MPPVRPHEPGEPWSGAEPLDREPRPDAELFDRQPQPDGDGPGSVGKSAGPFPGTEDRVTCWRCGSEQVLATSGKCRRCHARLARRIAGADEWSASSFPRHPKLVGGSGRHPVATVIKVYGLMLLTSVVWGWVLLASDSLSEEDVLAGAAVLEAVDTVLVLLVWARVGRQPLPDPPPGSRRLAWGLAVPVFGLLVGLNLLYGAVLTDWLKVREEPEAPALSAFVLIVVCVQPAVVEELFFRYVAFGVLRRSTGLHATVWVTAVMFAAAHIYNPLGMPYLFVAGLVLGYLRVVGGLALPMLLHFFHNLAVLLIEGAG